MDAKIDAPIAIRTAADFHIDRHGIVWITADDGARRLATDREKVRILEDEPDVMVQRVS